jgi:hypothetical protein
LASHSIQFHVRFGRAGTAPLGARFWWCFGAEDDLALPLTRAQGIECDVGRDPPRPSSKATVSLEGTIGQRPEDLLEARLNEVVVVVFPPAKYSKEGVVDHPNQSIVYLPGDSGVSLKDRVNELRVACRYLSDWLRRRRVTGDGAEPRTLGGGVFH